MGHGDEQRHTTIDEAERQRLVGLLHHRDRHVCAEAMSALCRAEDTASLATVVEVLEHAARYPEHAALEARRRLIQAAATAAEPLMEALRRNPGAPGGQEIAILLGEMAARGQTRSQAGAIAATLGEALAAVLAAGGELGGILMGLEYVSQLGPVQAATPVLRELCGRLARESDCASSVAASAVRVMYVSEGPAVLGELMALVPGLAPEHNLRHAIDGLVTARVADQPHYAHDPLPWERSEHISGPPEEPRPAYD